MAGKRGRDLADEEEEATAKKGKAPGAKTPAPRKAAPGGRRSGKLTSPRALSDDEERMRSVATFRRQLNRAHRQQQAPPPAGPREVIVPDTITVAELAMKGQMLAASTFKNSTVFTLVALLYLVMSVPLIVFVGWLERRTARK